MKKLLVVILSILFFGVVSGSAFALVTGNTTPRAKTNSVKKIVKKKKRKKKKFLKTLTKSTKK